MSIVIPSLNYGTVVGRFLVELGDSTDEDNRPDVLPAKGFVTFTPSISYATVQDSEPDPAVLFPQKVIGVLDSDGYLSTAQYDALNNKYFQTVDGQYIPSRRGVSLQATDDFSLNPYDWTWRADFSLRYPGATVTFPGFDFRLPSEYTLDLVQAIPIETSAGEFSLTGPRGEPGPQGVRGYGIEGISVTDGIIRIEWEGGDDVQVPIPSVTLATPTNDGLMSRMTAKAVEPIRKGFDDEWRIMDMQGAEALAVSKRGGVRVGGAETLASSSPFRLMDSEGRIAFEVDTTGRTHIYDNGDSSRVTSLHVFVAAGQSNMSGRGKPVEAPSSPRIMQFGANRRVIEQAPDILDMVDSPSGTSPASFFARNYLASQPDHVGVLLVPAARGATAFVGSPSSPAPGWTWTKGAAPSPEFALYERSVEQTLDAIAAAEYEGYHVVLKGVLWHQGEGNGGSSAYPNYFDALVSNYREDLDHPTLPVMVGQMCPEGMEVTPSKYKVDEAHQDTPYRTPFTGFAPAPRNGHNPGDTTHFSTAGNVHLGDTYATAYIQAVGNTHQRTT